MVIDTSALLAILLSEPEADALVGAIVSAETRLVAAPTLVEAAAVMVARKGPPGEVALDALLQRLEIQVVPMSPEAAAFARAAYARYGRGVGSPGVLNFGDCLAYGVARATGEPLLFKGDDLAWTDIERADA
jgi:ribonuclease VapC